MYADVFELPESLREAIDESVSEVLEKGQVVAPPVSAVELADRLGIVVASPSVRGAKRYPPAPEPRSASSHGDEQTKRERLAARAIARQHLSELADRLGVEQRSFTQSGIELLLSTFAARLLMPGQWFDIDAVTLGRDLYQLHQRYVTVSLESVAWRLLHLPDPTVVTVFESGHVVSRRANITGVPAEPTDSERRAQWHAHRYSLPGQESTAGIFARAWPIHRPDWRREIVVALLDSTV